MQIILLEKIGGLGSLGDIVTVKNGYARNYLIPQGKAKRATEANKAEFEARRAELEARQAEILADAQARKEKLDGQTVTVAQKAGVDGRLFGSVTNADIAAAIVAAGIEAAKPTSACRRPVQSRRRIRSGSCPAHRRGRQNHRCRSCGNRITARL